MLDNLFSANTVETKSRIVVAALAILTVLSGCFLLPKEEEILAPPLMKPPELTYRVVNPKRGNLYDRVVVSGYFTFPRQHSLSLNTGGRLKQINVDYGDLVEKGQVLAELENETIDRQIARQEKNVRIAQLNRARTLAFGADRYQEELEELKVQLAELTLRELREDLAKTKITANIPGVVVYVAQNEAGEYMAPYTSLVQLAEPTELLLSYTGANVSDFRLGQEVEVHVEEEVYAGNVVLTPESVPVNAPDNMRNKVFIDVHDLPPAVTKGFHAFIHLILDKAEGVLIVPRHVVNSYKGTTFVYVMEDGLRKQKTVKIGLQTSNEAAILEGLEETDAVISR